MTLSREKSFNMTFFIDGLKKLGNFKRDYQLANYLGVARNTISMWKTGKNSIYAEGY